MHTTFKHNSKQSCWCPLVLSNSPPPHSCWPESNLHSSISLLPCPSGQCIHWLYRQTIIQSMSPNKPPARSLSLLCGCPVFFRAPVLPCPPTFYRAVSASYIDLAAQPNNTPLRVLVTAESLPWAPTPLDHLFRLVCPCLWTLPLSLDSSP